MNGNRFASFAIVLLGAVVVGWLLFNYKTGPYVHTYRIECESLPPNDDALLRWLETHEDVKKASVQRDGTTVIVEFTSRESSPSVAPNPIPEAVAFGYKGLRKYTHTLRKRLW